MTMQNTPAQLRCRLSLRHVLICALLCLGIAAPAFAAGTLDKVKDTGRLTMGYASDTRPVSYSDASGKPAGYGVALCARVGDSIKSELKLSTLAVEFVALARDEAFGAVQQGKVDLLCGAVPTLERRALVDFSIPIMLSGTGVVVRADAPLRLVQVLSDREALGPTWRASTDQAPQRAVLAVVGGAPLEKALATRLRERRIVADVVTVKDTDAGLQMLAARTADAFFNDRAVLLDAVARSKSPHDFRLLDRLFRRDVVALAVRRNDDDFRLAVDRALSHLYRTPDLAAIYSSHFGPPGAGVLEFFQMVALPD
jgi:ABC-type amino acid transport substrate-binding protein